MADQHDGEQPAPAPRKLRDLFPEYREPSQDRLRMHIKEGLVVLDTNALFAAYRLNATGRREFLRTLELLEGRLWVPHRVAQEFLENRLDVIDECAKATADLNRSLKRSFDQVVKEIADFGARRGLSRDQVADLRKIVKTAQEDVRTGTEAAFTFGLKAKDCQDEDPILVEIEELLAGKIGEPLDDMDAARDEASRRYAYLVPPGYMDADKPADRAIGDYLVWAQVIEKTTASQRPVLLVSNDEKKDWFTERQCPRPELVAEMRTKTGQAFHLVNVRTFLSLANEYMDAKVSTATITQAEEMSREADEDTEAASPLEGQLLERLSYRPGRGFWPRVELRPPDPAVWNSEIIRRNLQNPDLAEIAARLLREMDVGEMLERRRRELDYSQREAEDPDAPSEDGNQDSPPEE
ncbi:PIN-like domain-containing protein [Actinomadura violacea]|uniref:DUF4935 domain-containing protein n=1 Tax=Actinomadura violacea TaxID=2819934 RepID=A0ABS3RT23_9ACTN|nr:PIN-like domain-containing protein [Actinomadura violacea]MBO2459812.1 DUF4935 domain-containing protein [Actinomadura violacea]